MSFKILIHIFIPLLLGCGKNDSEFTVTKHFENKVKKSNIDTVILYKYNETASKYYYFDGFDTLLFRLRIPELYDTSEAYPMLIFFHGAGERGRDNEKQMNYIGEFIDRDSLSGKSSFVFVPQCPDNEMWTDDEWSDSKSDFNEKPEKVMSLTIKAMKQLLEQYSVDQNRIYVMGLSMGGFATWDIITRFPGKFAAAVPICGGGDVKYASRFSSTAVWAFHGTKDKLVKVSRSREMIEALKEINKNVKYTEYSNVGHNSWVNAMNEKDLIPWIYSQRKDNK